MENVDGLLSICFLFFCFIILNIEILKNALNQPYRSWSFQIFNDAIMHWALRTPNRRYHGVVCTIKCGWILSRKQTWNEIKTSQNKVNQIEKRLYICIFASRRAAQHDSRIVKLGWNKYLLRVRIGRRIWVLFRLYWQR